MKTIVIVLIWLLCAYPRFLIHWVQILAGHEKTYPGKLFAAFFLSIFFLFMGVGLTYVFMEWLKMQEKDGDK